MSARKQEETARRRAPSQRSLATQARILDAAEAVFSLKGFDGATIRDVAATAGEQVSLIHHHGGGKEALFRKAVARRADDLADARRKSLETAKTDAALTVEAILRSFFSPLLTLAVEDAKWRAYARLVAYVSTDERWREIAADHFDPTAELFIDELVLALPGAARDKIAAGFVFAVSSMLAVITANWRIEALGGDQSALSERLDHLTAFCAGGLEAGVQSTSIQPRKRAATPHRPKS